MRDYKCDICGVQVHDVSNLNCIDFSHYGSSGTMHDYTDACDECRKRVYDFMNTLRDSYKSAA
jgi:hypothetical protein